jgi:hypothetical protein
MAVAVSQKRIREYGKEFGALDTAGAFRKAVELVEQLTALNALLFEHRRSLAKLLDEVVTVEPPRRSGAAASSRGAASVAAPPAPKMKGFVACPVCKCQLRADRLDRHLLTKHQTTLQEVRHRTATPPEPPKQPAPSPKALRARARSRAKAPVVCPQCSRSMPREDYAVHVCRLFARVVQGGAPGARG